MNEENRTIEQQMVSIHKTKKEKTEPKRVKINIVWTVGISKRSLKRIFKVFHSVGCIDILCHNCSHWMC